MEPPHSTTTRALLFSDVVDSTRLTERIGDAGSAAVWAEHDRRARRLLVAHRGLEIDRTDGLFLLFDDVVDAARYALDYHAELAGIGLAARIGLHAGPVILRENSADAIALGAKRVEVEGLEKPLAARIMGLSRGGQTLLSAAARAAVGASPPDGSELESHGHYRLKGIEDPVEVFELGRPGTGAFVPPADADKAYRVVRAAELWSPVREVRSNLLAERDSFVGRTDDLRRLALRLDDGARLVTLLGTGGTGKTRLVRRYGRAWLGDWPGGVYFCDLSDARSLDGIFFAVATALEVSLGKDDPVVQLGHAIAGRGRCLVVLDNFEQVVEHAPASLGRWLDRAGDAAFVVTSRERLRLPGESVLPLEPLPLATDAIELFAVRARAQRPDFALTETNHAAVAEVVRLLDGLPLAIELAAARLSVLSPAQLVERMRDRFRLLAGARGVAARQATMRAAIDWSWEMLVPWDQAALAQCSVFEGGFTLVAAEAVLDLAAWPEAPHALEAVQMLVDKCLLRTWQPGEPGRLDIGEPYFGMYVSIHDYAREKLLVRASDAVAAEQRHGRHFASLGSDEALRALSRHGGARRHRALVLELDNLVAACRRAIARRDGDVAVATYRAAAEVLNLQGPLALGVALGTQLQAMEEVAIASRPATRVTLAESLHRAGRTDQARAVLEDAIALARELGDRAAEATALRPLGDLQRALGQVEESRSLLEAALVIDRALGNRHEEGMALAHFGTLHHEQGRIDDALSHFAMALAIMRDVGDRAAEGMILNSIGLVHGERGEMGDARKHYDAALAIQREAGDRRLEASALSNLGMTYVEQGRLEEARAYYDASLALDRDVGSRRFEGIVLGNLGNLLLALGRIDEAREHYVAALAIHREVGYRRAEGYVLGYLGTLHQGAGETEKARDHFEQSLALVRAVGDLRFEGSLLASIAQLHLATARVDDAREALAKAEALLRQVGDRLELAKLLCVRGQLEVAAGDVAAARDALRAAEALASECGAGPDSDAGRDIIRLAAALGPSSNEGARPPV